MDVGLLFLLFGDRVPDPQTVAPSAKRRLERGLEIVSMDWLFERLVAAFAGVRLPCRSKKHPDKNVLAATLATAVAWQMREQGTLEIQGLDSPLDDPRIEAAVPGGLGGKIARLSGRSTATIRLVSSPSRAQGIEAVIAESLERYGGSGWPTTMVASVEARKHGEATNNLIARARDHALAEGVYTEGGGRDSVKLAGKKVGGDCAAITGLEPEFERRLGDWTSFCAAESQLANAIYWDIYQFFNPPAEGGGGGD